MLEKNKICKTNGRVMVPVSRTVNLEYIWGTIACLCEGMTEKGGLE